MIPIFSLVLISDKNKNATLFHLSKYSGKLYCNIVCKMQIEMSNLYSTCTCNQLHLYLPQFINLLFLFYDLSYIQLKSLIGFSRLTIYKVRISSTLIAFLIKIINKIRSNNQIRSYSQTVILRHHWTCFDGFYIITDTNYKLLVSTSLCLQLDSKLLPISS